MKSLVLSPTDYWRAIILYGLNPATYKIALGQALVSLVRRDATTVSMADLAAEFFDLYSARLQSAKPQLLLPGRLTVMERIVSQLNAGRLDRGQAIDLVERQAFGDVVPRFHTVGDEPVPVRFYDHTPNGLVLTDAAFRVFGAGDAPQLEQELAARWDLLEAAFELKRDTNAALANDLRQIYLARGYDRTDVTPMRPVLNGYQQGRCFYCSEQMEDDDVRVDHLIPRQFVFHDEVWNLVLAHSLCNGQKTDAIPHPRYVDRLIARNEHFIASNHPIKHKLIAQLGATAEKRRAEVFRQYDDARVVIPYTWEGLRGFDPEQDLFYRRIVRGLAR